MNRNTVQNGHSILNSNNDKFIHKFYNFIVMVDEANSEEEGEDRKEGMEERGQDLGKGYRITWWGSGGIGSFLLRQFI